jgi:hypothetical protein
MTLLLTEFDSISYTLSQNKPHFLNNTVFLCISERAQSKQLEQVALGNELQESYKKEHTTTTTKARLTPNST